ncbi:hypothetical protein FA95DRAFT_1551734 [Auriscalpium vulgare]|uniref:Uncharacterized protein n=1 Tax=Auriscalpium vulgare TaxID=40419 RepID=A0ACB8SDE8_9AGAM|nr:hypothetical protein FA95DRAFT_1551734 [Auriscalpium vulgare]
MGEEPIASGSGEGSSGHGDAAVAPSLLYHTDTQPYYVDVDLHADSTPSPWESYPLYERHADDVLGDEFFPEAQDADVSRCFNCGSADHMLPSCPSPRNHELISLSRQLFHFFRPERSSEPMTISAAGEHKRLRLAWLELFEPGEVRGVDLRDALSLHEDDAGMNVPWLKNMAEWGYPRGWVGWKDPRHTVYDRVQDRFTESLDFGDDDCVLTLFAQDEETLDLATYGGVEALGHRDRDVSCASPESRGNPSQTGTVDRTTSPESPRPSPIRWATYPPTYFSSDLLPLYTGARLPPVHRMSSTTYSEDRRDLWEKVTVDVGIHQRQNMLNPPAPDSEPPPLPPTPAPLLPPQPPVSLSHPPSSPRRSTLLAPSFDSQSEENGGEEADMDFSDSD